MAVRIGWRGGGWGRMGRARAKSRGQTKTRERRLRCAPRLVLLLMLLREWCGVFVRLPAMFMSMG